MVWWIAPALFAATALGLLWAALIADARNISTSLYIMLPLVLCLSVASMLMELSLRLQVSRAMKGKDDDDDDDEETGVSTVTDDSETKETNVLDALDEKLRPSSLSICMIMTPSIALFWILFLRLIVGEDHFDGHAPMLDFGPINGIEGGESNIAFDDGGGGNSLLNSLQGECAAFLAFPAVSRTVAALLGGRGRRTIICLGELLSAAFTLFPIYLLFQGLEDFDEPFATSKYVSQATEWVLGYCVGISAGFFVTALVETKLLGDIDPCSPADEDIQVDKVVASEWHRFIHMVHILFGLFMILTVVAFSFLFGYSWNRCMGDATDCINYADGGDFDVLVVSLFCTIPVVMIGASALREKCR